MVNGTVKMRTSAEAIWTGTSAAPPETNVLVPGSGSEFWRIDAGSVRLGTASLMVSRVGVMLIDAGDLGSDASPVSIVMVPQQAFP